MRVALEYLKGTHDFRNFCKMDVANGVVNFVRNITDVYIENTNKSESESGNFLLFITFSWKFEFLMF